MTQMNQKEAVFHFITNIKEIGSGPVILSDSERKEVIHSLVEGFQDCNISYKGTLPTEPELRKYVSGMLSNWLRKDTRLNGGVKYEAKNPGSRAGSSDPQVKAMRALLKTLDSNDPRRATVEATLNSHIEANRATKQKVTVNFEDLPESLRAQFESSED